MNNEMNKQHAIEQAAAVSTDYHQTVKQQATELKKALYNQLDCNDLELQIVLNGQTWLFDMNHAETFGLFESMLDNVIQLMDDELQYLANK